MNLTNSSKLTSLQGLIQLLIDYLQEIANLGTDTNYSEELNKKIRLTNQVCVTIIFICFPFVLIYNKLGLIIISSAWLLVILLFVGLLVINYFGFYNLSRYGLVAFGNLSIICFSIFLGEPAGKHHFLYAGIAGAFIIFSKNEIWAKIYAIGLPTMSLLLIETTFTEPLLVNSLSIDTIQTLNVLNIIFAIVFITLNQYYLYRENAISTERMQKANQQYEQLTKELETRVEERTAELRETNQDLSAYNHSISHELRTPLRPIRSLTHILKDRYADQISQEAHQILDEIDHSSSQMMNLIEGLLTFSRTGQKQVEKEEVNMKEFIQMVYASIKPANQDQANNINLVIETLPHACIDKKMFNHVIQNLLSNAIKYAADRNPINIRWQSWQGDGEVIFAIHDNGIGFEPSKKEEIFKAFQRLHARTKFEGSGIGLAITERILRKHDGKIWAESTPGEGSSFYFSLPSNG